MADLVLGKDYTLTENGLVIFTAEYLLKKGKCCESGCLNCPYGFNHLKIDPLTPQELSSGWSSCDTDDSEF